MKVCSNGRVSVGTVSATETLQAAVQFNLLQPTTGELCGSEPTVHRHTDTQTICDMSLSALTGPDKKNKTTTVKHHIPALLSDE